MTNSQAKNGVPERYAQALEGAEPLEVLRKSPKRLARLVRDARRKDLEARPAPDAWSVRDVLAHLADHEFVLGSRLRMVASHDRPALSAYDEQLFAARLGAERSSAERLLAAFAGARAANLELLGRVAEDAWGRVGVHAERGELTLLDLVRSTAGHDRVHEAQVQRTLAAARAARKEAKARARAERKAEKRGERPGQTPEERAAQAEASAEKQARRARRKVRTSEG